MSTQARRYCGASISMAGRFARTERSRPTDSSVNLDTGPRLRLDDGNALHGVLERDRRAAQLARNVDRRALAGREVARQLEPASVGDEVIPGLAVRFCFQRRVADVLDGQYID